MDFELEHSFDAPADEVAAALLDESFQNSLSDLEPLRERTLLTQEARAGGTVVRQTRCVLDMELSGTVQRFVGSSEASWVEEAEWHPDERRWSWKIVPDVAKDLLSSSGTTELVDDGAGSLRRIRGSVSVRVPFYGGKVEGWIVNGIEEAYENEAERLREWLA